MGGPSNPDRRVPGDNFRARVLQPPRVRRVRNDAAGRPAAQHSANGALGTTARERAAEGRVRRIARGLGGSRGLLRRICFLRGCTSGSIPIEEREIPAACRAGHPPAMLCITDGVLCTPARRERPLCTRLTAGGQKCRRSRRGCVTPAPALTEHTRVRDLAPGPVHGMGEGGPRAKASGLPLERRGACMFTILAAWPRSFSTAAS